MQNNQQEELSEDFILRRGNEINSFSVTRDNDRVQGGILNAMRQRNENDRRKYRVGILASTGIASGIIFFGLGGAFSQDDKDISNVLFIVGGGILATTALLTSATYKKYYGNNVRSHDRGSVSEGRLLVVGSAGSLPNFVTKVSTQQVSNIHSPQEEVVRELTPPYIQDEQIQEEGALQSKFDSTASPQKMEPVAMRPNISILLPRLTRNISSSHDDKSRSI